MIYFQSIVDDVDTTEYIGTRLDKFLEAVSHDQRATLLHRFTLPGIDGGLPHFLPTDNPEGADEAIAAARETAKLFPMTQSEQIVEEELCVLWPPFPESSNGNGTDGPPLYLRQRTNFAEVFIEVPNRNTNGSEETAPEVGAVEETAEPEAAIPVWALTLAKTLGTHILQAAASYVWDKVRKEVLGQTDLPDYYQEVYAEIRRIVAYAFDQHYLKEVRDLAHKFDMTMVHYNNMGRSEADFHIVKNTSFDLITKSNALGSPGAFHYAEATILHIMTLQEGYKRLVEAGASPEQLAKSKKYISDMARQFADNVTVKRNNLLTERMARISTEPFFRVTPDWNPNPGRTIAGVREGGHRDDGFRGDGPVGPFHNRFEDSDNGFWNSMWFNHWREIGSPGHSWNWVNGNLQRYRGFIHNQTVAEIQPLLDVAQRLRDLAAKPVG